jgi:hypothetical protein
MLMQSGIERLVSSITEHERAQKVRAMIIRVLKARSEAKCHLSVRADVSYT